MELLYFMGCDKPINVIHSSSIQRKPLPYVNIHLFSGGMSQDQLKDFFTSLQPVCKQTEENIIYLIIPSKYETQFEEDIQLKWLLKRQYNSQSHILICENELYDRYFHKSNQMNWITSQNIMQNLVRWNNPFARWFQSEDCEWRFTHTRSNEMMIDIMKTTSTGSFAKQDTSHFYTFIDNQVFNKLYIGCIIQQDTDSSLIPSHVECVVYYKPSQQTLESLNQYENQGEYIYFFDDIVIRCKRSLSSFLQMNKYLHALKVYFWYKNYDDCFHYESLMQSFDDYMIPYEIKTTPIKKIAYTVNFDCSSATSLLKVENISLLINTIKKSFTSDHFGLISLHSIPLSSFIDVYNETSCFVESNHSELQAFVVGGQPEKENKLIMPYICPVTQESLEIKSKVKLDYYATFLGDDDLAEQMIQYANISTNFHCIVHTHKQKWKQILLQNIFQNVDLIYKYIGLKDVNKFSLSFHKQPFQFIFHSSILHEMKRILSFYQAQKISCIGLHIKHLRKGLSMTSNCHLEYYRNAIEHIEKENQGKQLVYIICGDYETATEGVIEWLINTKRKVDILKHLDVYQSLALLSCCNGLILSSSSFAYWAGVLNHVKNANIICPKNWYNDLYFLSSHSSNDCIPSDWFQIDN